MTAHAFPAIRNVLACLLAGLALPAAAIVPGELRVHSALGDPLDATVSVEGGTDAKPRADCFRQARPDGRDLPALPRATFAVEPDGSGWRVRVRTRAAIAELAVRLRLEVACEGEVATSRDYEILLDPRAPESPSPPMRTVAGDSLSSIAAAIHPRSRAVREAYVRALRVANASLAGLAPDEPIAPGTEVALPDLRRFSLSLAVSPAAPRPALPVVIPREALQAPPPARAPAGTKPVELAATEPAKAPAKDPAKAPAKDPAKTPGPKPQPPAAVPKQEPATKKAQSPSPGRSDAFVLRLSSPAVDLSRSRGIDDRTRAQLRERLLILDADDQVSALLAMRNSLKQLEGRVAELQLKLSTLPPPVPAPAAPSPAPPLAKAAPEPPKPTEAAKPREPAKSPEPAATQTEPVKPPEPAMAPEPAAPADAAKLPAPVEPLGAAPKKTSAPVALPPAPQPVEALPQENGVPIWLWVVLAAAVAGIAVLAWRLLSPPRPPVPSPPPQAPAHSDLREAEAMMSASAGAAPGGHRVVAESDQSLATNVPGADPVALRRRYIEERFPEIASGTIAPADPDSVVKAARLFYEDGALARAVELLQFSVEESPRTLKPWLALFEIFRLENRSGEFGELAGRFRQYHGATDFWRKVQFIGREIEPGNALYRETAVDHLETIGPAASRKAMPVIFDPLAENWLNAPMDFTTDALAASLRAGLLADAGVADTDLVADPMPALKNVEMFTVA